MELEDILEGARQDLESTILEYLMTGKDKKSYLKALDIYLKNLYKFYPKPKNSKNEK